MRVQGDLCVLVSLSGPCELLFLLCFIASWTSVVVSLLYFCVALFVLCVASLRVFVNCLGKQYALFLNEVVILLLNVMEVLSVGGGGGALLVIPCMCVVCM